MGCYLAGVDSDDRRLMTGTGVTRPFENALAIPSRAFRPARSQGAKPSRSTPSNQSPRIVREVALEDLQKSHRLPSVTAASGLESLSRSQLQSVPLPNRLTPM